MDVIVVGMDGSPNAARALRWALHQASVSGSRILAVGAWSASMEGFGGAGYAPPIAPAECERVARAALDLAVSDVLADFPGDVEVEQRTVEGGAAHVLLDEAHQVGAALLVVGSRGRGGFAGLRLGSVSSSLAHHTPCPLAIIPPAPDDQPA